MHCQNCGSPVKEGEKYCANCGANLEQMQNEATVLNNQPVIDEDTRSDETQPLQEPAYVPPVYSTNEPAAPVYAPVKKKKKKTGLIVTLIILASVLLIAGLFCAWFFLLRVPPVESFVLSETDVYLAMDEQETVNYTIMPEKANKKQVVWKSSDESVATVDANGRITARGNGECTITATVDKKTASVEVAVLELQLSESEISLSRGETYTLTCTATPSSFNKKIKWKSSDSDIAAVDQDGVVTGKKGGECKITAKIGEISVSAKVTVAKLNPQEASVVGRWKGDFGYVNDQYKSYSGYMVLYDDLTGYYEIGDTKYYFTWYFYLQLDNGFTLKEVEDDGTYDIYYLSKSDSLVLQISDSFRLFYDRD